MMLYLVALNEQTLFKKNSLKIHEENTKKITAVSVVLYVIKFHVNLLRQR